jgi:hypothetical protein
MEFTRRQFRVTLWRLINLDWINLDSINLDSYFAGRFRSAACSALSQMLQTLDNSPVEALSSCAAI